MDAILYCRALYKLRGAREGFNIGLNEFQKAELDGITAEQFWVALKAENLRLKMQAKGGQTSKYIGVHWNRGSWEARIRNNGRQKRLGYFSDEREAADAYDAAVVERDGEKAMTNAKYFAGDFSSLQFSVSNQATATFDQPRATTTSGVRSSRQENGAAGDGAEGMKQHTAAPRRSSSAAKRGSVSASGKSTDRGCGKGKASQRKKGKKFVRRQAYSVLQHQPCGDMFHA